jgi:hypothetical protein
VTAFELVEAASRLGVTLWGDGDELRFRAPIGALPDSLRAALSANRAEVVVLLRSRSSQADAALALVQEAIDQANAIKPTVRFEVLAGLVRQYHAAGDLEMLGHALVTARRMLAGLRRPTAPQTTAAPGSRPGAA